MTSATVCGFEGRIGFTEIMYADAETVRNWTSDTPGYGDSFLVYAR